MVWMMKEEAQPVAVANVGFGKVGTAGDPVLSTRICKGQAQGSANRRREWWWLGADQTRD